MKDKNKTIKLILNEIDDQGILEAIGDGISIQDTNFRVVYQNQTHKDFIGEHIGEYCYKAFEKEEHVCDGCPVAKAFQDGKTHMEERSILSEKGISYFQITASPLRDITGQIIAGIESVRDITDNRNAENLLLQSEAKNKSILSAIPDLMFRLSSRGNHLEFYTSNLNELYLDPTDFLGKRVDEVLPPGVGEKYLYYIEQTINTGQMQVFEYYLDFPEGTRYFESRMVTYREDEILVIVRNITERKNIENLLKEREQYLQSIINTEPECVKIVLSDGTLMQMNSAGLNMIEADSFEQVMGKSIYPIVVPEYRDAFRKLTESVCLGNQGLLEFEIIGLKGTRRWLETHAVSLRDAQNEIIGLLGVTRDITEHKKALEEIKQLNNELEEIIYTTSHDLRSPLVNIHGYSRELAITYDEISNIFDSEEIVPSLRLKLSPLIKDIKQSMRYIDSGVSKMDSLLSGLLKLSRTGRTELRMEEIDMNSLMTDIYNFMDFQVRESGAKVEIEDLPPCKGDKELLNQLFSNLLNNALKFLDKGRESKIKVSGSIKNGGHIYYVEDNGIGISPEHLEKIFDIFYQLDSSRNDDEGLGLAIVKKIIRKHKGKVWVESELGKGSKFFVLLPKD